MYFAIARETISDVLVSPSWGDIDTERQKTLCISQHMMSDRHFYIAAVR
jgi:hypothetical protein